MIELSEDQNKILNHINDELVLKQRDIDIDVVDAVNEHFWELLND